MSKGTKVWNEQELTIAFYIAKWGYAGLKDTSEEEIAMCIISDTTVQSLRMQVANFRFVLGLEGRTLKDASKAMYELNDKLTNKTMSQVRSLILPTINDADVCVNDIRVKGLNLKVRAISDKKQAAMDAVYDNKVKDLQKHRNLRKL